MKNKLFETVNFNKNKIAYIVNDKQITYQELWKIANEYGTTVNQLMTINNLSSSNLSIGDTLLIPTN